MLEFNWDRFENTNAARSVQLLILQGVARQVRNYIRTILISMIGYNMVAKLNDLMKNSRFTV